MKIFIHASRASGKVSLGIRLAIQRGGRCWIIGPEKNFLLATTPNPLYPFLKMSPAAGKEPKP